MTIPWPASFSTVLFTLLASAPLAASDEAPAASSEAERAEQYRDEMLVFEEAKVIFVPGYIPFLAQIDWQLYQGRARRPLAPVDAFAMAGLEETVERIREREQNRLLFGTLPLYVGIGSVLIGGWGGLAVMYFGGALGPLATTIGFGMIVIGGAAAVLGYGAWYVSHHVLWPAADDFALPELREAVLSYNTKLRQRLQLEAGSVPSGLE